MISGLRTSLLWLLPLAFTVAAVLWAIPARSLPNLAHYWQSAFAMATFVSLPGVVAFGLAATVCAANQRAALPFIRSSLRPSWQILIRDLAPLFLGFVASYLIVFTYLASKVGEAADFPPLLILFVIPAIATATLLMGYACGLLLSRPIAFAASALIPLIWGGFAVASPIFALHYTSGLLFADCCRVGEVLDTQPLLVSIFSNLAFALAMLGLVFLLLKTGARRVGTNLIALGVVATWLTLIVFGSHAASTPIAERPREQLQCQGTMPKICLFPMQDASNEVASTLKVSWARLREIHRKLPATLVGTTGGLNEVGVNILTSSNQSEIAYSMAANSIGSPEYCDEPEAQQWQRDLTYRLLQNLFLDRIDGYPAATKSWKLQLLPAESELLSDIESKSRIAQQHWVSKALTVTHDCQIQPKI